MNEVSFIRMVELIDYVDKYAPEFKRINLEWLDKYHLTEVPDLRILDDPRGTILNSGGVIYLARANGMIVGSAALINEHNGVYELAKMAVIPHWQGKGISNLLIERCLNKARELKAKKVILFSNHQLQSALGLYRKYGFERVELTDSPFQTADVRMELVMQGD
jgi:putative acetyltransferase